MHLSRSPHLEQEDPDIYMSEAKVASLLSSASSVPAEVLPLAGAVPSLPWSRGVRVGLLRALGLEQEPEASEPEADSMNATWTKGGDTTKQDGDVLPTATPCACTMGTNSAT